MMRELHQEIKEIADFLEKTYVRTGSGIYWPKADEDYSVVKMEMNEYIYSGNAGICLFFIELYEFYKTPEYLEIIKNSSRWIYNRSRKNSSENYAFITGRIGTAYILALSGKLLKKEAYLTESLRVSREAISALNKTTKFDYLNGLAGTLIGLLQIYDLIPEEEILQGISLGTIKLIENMSFNKKGIFWDWKPFSIAPLSGLSHGSAGFAYVFLELSKFFNDDKLLEIASLCLRHENRQFEKEINNWPDFRIKKDDDGTYRFPSMDNKSFMDCAAWCHGAPGIGLVRQLFQENGKKTGIYRNLKVKNCIEKTYSQNRENRLARPSLVLCHGISGNGFVFLNRNHRKYKYATTEFVQSIIAAKSRNRGYYSTHSHINNVVDPSLFLGLAGIGYYFLFILNKKESSILLPKINIKDFAPPKINFIELLIGTLAEKTFPRYAEKIAGSIPSLAMSFSTLYNGGKIRNEITFLTGAIEDLIENTGLFKDEIQYLNEKYATKLALNKIVFMAEEHFEDSGTYPPLAPTKSDEIKKFLQQQKIILNKKAKIKRFKNDLKNRHYLYMNYFNKIDSREMNQFQMLIVEQFYTAKTFEDAYRSISTYIDTYQQEKQVYKLITDEFFYLFKMNILTPAK